MYVTPKIFLVELSDLCQAYLSYFARLFSIDLRLAWRVLSQNRGASEAQAKRRCYLVPNPLEDKSGKRSGNKMITELLRG